MLTDESSVPTPRATDWAICLARRIVMLITLLALPSLAAAQNNAVTLIPAGNPPPAPPWAWPGGPTNSLVLSGTSNSPYAITGIAQVNITMTHSYIGDATIRLEFTPSTGPGAGVPISVDILNQLGQTISIGSVGYSSNLGGSYTFIDAPAGQNTLANGNTNYTPASGPYRAYGKYSVPTTLSTSLVGVVGTGTWSLSFATPGMSGGIGGGPNTVSAASVTFTSGGCPSAWTALGSAASGGFAMAALPGGDVMVGDAGRYDPTTNVWTPLATRTNGSVVALAVTPTGEVIVGGSFTTAGGGAASNIARYNPTTGVWSALGAGGGGVSGGTVYAVVALPGGDVLAGGSFTSAGGVAVNRVARYNPTTNAWSAMGTGLIGSSSAGGPTAYAMALLPSGTVVIAGDFFSGNGVSSGGFIRYNPTSGVWTSTAGPGIANYTAALAVLPGGDVIAGGTSPVFPPGGGQYLLGRYNPTTNVWTGLGVFTSGIVSSLTTLPSGEVMVGGASLTTAGGVPVNGIGRCNPNTDVWTGLGSGVSRTPGPANVAALVAIPNGDVIAAGVFSSAGGVAVNGIARYAFGSPAPSIVGQPSPASACVSGVASFTVVAAGAGPFTYQWRKNGTPINTATNPSAATATLSLTSVQASDAASYDCVVSDACGSVTSNAAALSICPADFNCSGTVSVQDIFDFLAGYFAADPRADFNSSGAISVQDIFDFLAAYFAGCN